MNTLYYGDNLKILRDYIKDESVDLVYLDPPFNSNRNYNVLFRNESGSDSESQITAFEDTWHWNLAAEQTYSELINEPDQVGRMIESFRQFIGNNQMMAYLVMMAVRLKELHRVPIIALLNITLMLVYCLTSDAQAIRQPILTIGEAKSKLEQLQGQLLRVDKEAREEVDRTIAEQVNSAPKGEFETAKEFEVRNGKADELRQQIEERVDRKKETRKEDLNRLLNEILTMEFNMPFEARLGTYDADTQKFPLLLSSENQESLFVPRPEAKELKENFSQAEKVGTIGLHLDYRNHAEEYLLSGKISYLDKVYRIENTEMNVARAMFMLYGNYDPANNRAKWRGEAALWEETATEYQQLEAIPIFKKIFRENNMNKFILVTGSVAEGEKEFGDCHACGVKIGMAVFSQKSSIWKLEVGEKDVGTYGAFGIPPEASLVKIGVDRYVLTFSWGDMHQGVADAGVDYVDRFNGIFKEILSLHTSEDTSGFGILDTAKDNISFDSKIVYVQGSNPAYFDISVTARGKRGAKVGRRVIMRPFVEVKVYKFSDGVYKLSDLH